jgi:tripartite-type tricarboxylate transporter receptor subunit TctC
LEPGSEKIEGVRVINNTVEKKTLLVYVADSTPSTGGAFACKQFSEEKKDVGAWVTLTKTEVTLNPNSNEIIPFTIKAPANVSVGEHNGCILIQEKKESVKGQAGVSLSVRTGIRLAITIP